MSNLASDLGNDAIELAKSLGLAPRDAIELASSRGSLSINDLGKYVRLASEGRRAKELLIGKLAEFIMREGVADEIAEVLIGKAKSGNIAAIKCLMSLLSEGSLGIGIDEEIEVSW